MSVPPPSSLRPSSRREFSADQSRIIGKLGVRAVIWGVLCTIGGFLSVGVAILRAVSQVRGEGAFYFILVGITLLSVGLSFSTAGTAMRRVASTTGNDMPLLLEAFTQLGSAMRVQVFATFVFVIGLAISIALSMSIMHGLAL